MHYLIRTLKHKYYVLLAGLKLGGIPLWRLLIHDWSKLLPVELSPYNRLYRGDSSDPAGFAQALLHHWNANPHHYQYWCDRPDHSDNYRALFEQSGLIENGVFEMPETYAREMVADWMGANRIYTGGWDMSKWLAISLSKMTLHSRTKKYIIKTLNELGYDQASNWMHNKKD